MRLDVITLFSEFFASPLSVGLIGKARAAGAFDVAFIDPRAFTTDRHRTVDDTPYGGGAGMVMKPEPLAAAIRASRSGGAERVLMATPQGRPLQQSDLHRWADMGHLAMVAGRYEGFDERVRGLIDEEVSLGDFVVTGGEYAALTIIDGVVRLLPGTLGNADSATADSFSSGLLEHPHFTRPPSFEGQAVPEVLRSGDHAAIETWRVEQALLRTAERRPDLLRSTDLSEAARRALRLHFPDGPAGRFSMACGANIPVSEAIFHLALAYRVRLYWPSLPAAELQRARASLAPVVLERPGRKRRTTETVRVSAEAVIGEGAPEGLIVSLDPSAEAPRLTPSALREASHVVVTLGDPGLEPAARFGPIRPLSAPLSLDPLARAAVALDRLVGEALFP